MLGARRGVLLRPRKQGGRREGRYGRGHQGSGTGVILSLFFNTPMDWLRSKLKVTTLPHEIMLPCVN